MSSGLLRWSRWHRLLLLLVVLQGSADEAVCDARGGTCNESPGPTLPLTALLVDGIMLRLCQVWPQQEVGPQLRLASQVSSACLLALPGAGEDALVSVGFDGEVQWFRRRAGLHVPMQSMGKLVPSQGSTISATMSPKGVKGVPTLALGHRKGRISLWQFRPEYVPRWQEFGKLQAAHHHWEQTDLVALSEDGRLLLACTGDNVVLWQLPTVGELRLAKELKHLHGGADAVAAAVIQTLPAGGYLVLLSRIKSSLMALRAPGAEEEVQEATELWTLQRQGLPRLTAVATAVMSSDTVAPHVVVVGGADQGQVSLWKLAADGSLTPGMGEQAQWEVDLKVPHAVGALALLSEESGCWAAVSAGGQVAVLHCGTGAEIFRAKHSSVVLKLLWAAPS